MNNKANQEIRKATENAGLKLWMVADKLGMADSCFSRKMRKELPTSEKERILIVIDKMKKEESLCKTE